MTARWDGKGLGLEGLHGAHNALGSEINNPQRTLLKLH